MHYTLLFDKYISVKRLLEAHLVKAASISTYREKAPYIEDKKIHLYQGRDVKKKLYISSLALRLANSQNSNAMKVAHELAVVLSGSCGGVFHVQIVPPGCIHLELTPTTLAAWLQGLAGGNLAGEETKDFRECKLLFPIQYAHARCYSLIRLASQDNLIELVDGDVGIGGLIAARPISWLNGDQQLYFYQPEEYHLINQLMQVVDHLVCSDGGSVDWEKIGGKLSQAWEDFWCSCRIWGEVKITSPELAQARVGLLIATQWVLKCLLEKKLGVVALREL
ncbi:hypothetical protein VB711_00840 [Cronbergia sp. UHCC 0137]|uniref:hypothetical protein n=1 Tax=Cronbergia sp. UHCC 0137 TaxID=3110239 RepID=UPI002B21298B|nr:hypothetical protein [Cronbergia sp. UHCC 0137]MEA5616390.1 hypothetical protein [Cronbergia sp. UHCC 0137]